MHTKEIDKTRREKALEDKRKYVHFPFESFQREIVKIWQH